MEQQKGVIYARVSTDKQEYSRQLEQLKNYAERSNINIVQILEEKESGLNSERPEYNKLIKLTKEDIDVVLVWEISRLSRKSIEIQTDIQRFFEKGINVFIFDRNLYTLLPDGKENPTAKLIIAIIATIAEEEIKTLKRRMISTKQHNVLNEGKSYTSQAPIGYDLKNQILYINESEAEVVKRIFNLSAEGNSFYSIAIKLNSEDIKSKKGNIWTAPTIKSLLENKTYYGKAKYVTKSRTIKSKRINCKNSRIIEDYTYVDCPAIITKELFDLVQQKKKERRSRSATNVGNPYLLKHLIKCKSCGTYFTIDRGKDRERYRCARQFNKDSKKPKCNSPITQSNNINFIVWDLISYYYKELYLEDKRIEDKDKINAEINIKAKELESITETIAIKNKQVETIYAEYINLKSEFPDLTDLHNKEKSKLTALQTELKRYKTEQTKINNDISSLKSKVADLASINTDVDLSTLDFNAKYEFLHKIVDHIYINNTAEKYEIFIQIYLKNGRSLNVHYLPRKRQYIYIDLDSNIPNDGELIKEYNFTSIGENLNFIKRIVTIPDTAIQKKEL